MATLVLTFPATNGGASARAFGNAVLKAVGNVPDNLATALTITIDNAPATGAASVVVTAPTDYVYAKQTVG